MRTSTPVFVLLTLLVAVAGCNLNVNYFGDYTGKNILGNSGFGSGKWSLVSDPTLAAGGYTPAYSSSDYMRWEAVGNVGNTDHSYDINALTSTVGPDGSSPSYRVEIKNLIPDGDFEGETNTTSFLASETVPAANGFWLPTAAISIASSGTLNSVPAYISGDHQAVAFNTGPSASTMTLAIDKAVTATTAGFWSRAGSYRFRFDFYNYSTGSSFDLSLTGIGVNSATVSSGGVWNFSTLPAATAPSVVPASFLLINDGSAPAWTVNFGGALSDQIILDNVRLLNISVDPSVALSFSSLSSGSATLIPGTKSGAYVFSVYVRDDPTADQTQSAGTIHLVNRFYASGLTIVLKAAVKSGSGTYSTFIARPPGGWGSWTKITVNAGFDFVDSDSQLNGQSALVVELSPTNASNVNVQFNGNSTVSADRDVGSLLVAQPVLTFNP